MTPSALSKEEYDKLRESFLNDKRYLDASAEDKQKMLDNYYNSYTVSYLQRKDIPDKNEVERLRGVFKDKYGPQKKKESTQESQEPVTRSAEELQDFSGQEDPTETQRLDEEKETWSDRVEKIKRLASEKAKEEKEKKPEKDEIELITYPADGPTKWAKRDQPEELSQSAPAVAESAESLKEIRDKAETGEELSTQAKDFIGVGADEQSRRREELTNARLEETLPTATEGEEDALSAFKFPPPIIPTYDSGIPDFIAPIEDLPNVLGFDVGDYLKKVNEGLKEARKIYGEDFINTENPSKHQQAILDTYINATQHAGVMANQIEDEANSKRLMELIQHDPYAARDVYKKLGYKEPVEFAYVEMQDKTGGGMSRAYQESDYLNLVPLQQAKSVALVTYKRQLEAQRTAKELNWTQIKAQQSGMRVDDFIESEKETMINELAQRPTYEYGLEWGTDPMEYVGKQYKAMNQLEKWTNMPEGTEGRQEKIDYYNAQIELYDKKRFEDINEQIKELKSERKKASTAKQKSIDKEIEYLEGFKTPIFNQDPVQLATQIASDQSSSSMSSTLMDLINPRLDLTPKEKFDMWYYSLYTLNRRMGHDLGISDPNEVPIGLSTRDMLEWDAVDAIVGEGTFSTTEAEREWVKNETLLRQLAPIFFTNKMQVSADQGFGQSFVNTFSQGITPTVGGLTNPLEQVTAMEIANQLTSMGFDQGDINSEAIETLVTRATPKPLFGEGFSLFSPSTWDKFDLDPEKAGQTTGALAQNMAVFYLSNAFLKVPIGKGMTSLTKNLDKINKISTRYNNYLSKSPRITKWLANPIKEATEQGLVFEATGRIFTNQEEEFNFMSGFLGTFFGDVTKTGINTAFTKLGSSEALRRLESMFGAKTPQAIAYLTDKGISMGSRGTGELVEETVQEFTQIWRETPNGQAFFEELEKRFGKMSDVEEFIVVSFAMGSVYGMADGNKYFQQQYKNLNQEQKQRVSQVADEILTDVVGANAEALKHVQGDPFLASQLGLAPEIEGATYEINGKKVSSKKFHETIHSEKFKQDAFEGNVNYKVDGDEGALGVAQKAVELAKNERAYIDEIQNAKTEQELNKISDYLSYDNLVTQELLGEITKQREAIRKGEVPMVVLSETQRRDIDFEKSYIEKYPESRKDGEKRLQKMENDYEGFLEEEIKFFEKTAAKSKKEGNVEEANDFAEMAKEARQKLAQYEQEIASRQAKPEAEEAPAPEDVAELPEGFRYVEEGEVIPAGDYVTRLSVDGKRTITNAPIAETTPTPEVAEEVSEYDQAIINAREGDEDAQATLDEYGIAWEKEEVVRFVGESEVDALMNNQKIEGKNKEVGVDVTKDVEGENVPATSAEYRVRFKGDKFDDKMESSGVQMKNDQDGWVKEGYDINDVDVIEQRQEDGTYKVVYDSKAEQAPTPEVSAEQQAEIDELTRDRDALPEGSRARALIDQEIARIQETIKPKEDAEEGRKGAEKEGVAEVPQRPEAEKPVRVRDTEEGVRVETLTDQTTGEEFDVKFDRVEPESNEPTAVELSDGSTLVRTEDGKYTDGDQTYDSYDELIKTGVEVGFIDEQTKSPSVEREQEIREGIKEIEAGEALDQLTQDAFWNKASDYLSKKLGYDSPMEAQEASPQDAEVWSNLTAKAMDMWERGEIKGEKDLDKILEPTEETPILERPPVQQKAFEGPQKKWKGEYEDQPVSTDGVERREYDIEGRKMHYVEPTTSEVESINQKLIEQEGEDIGEFKQTDNLIVDSTTGEVLGIGYATDRRVYSRVFFNEFKKEPTEPTTEPTKDIDSELDAIKEQTTKLTADFNEGKISADEYYTKFAEIDKKYRELKTGKTEEGKKPAKIEKKVSDGEALASQFNRLSKKKRQTAVGQDLMLRAIAALNKEGIEHELKTNNQGTRIVRKETGTLFKAETQEETVAGEYETLATDKSGYSLVKTDDGEIVPVNKDGKVVRNYRHKKRLLDKYKKQLISESRDTRKHPEADVDYLEAVASPESVRMEIAENSRNPRQIAEAWLEEMDEVQERRANPTLEELIMGEEGGRTTPITISSFDNAFDPNLRKGRLGKVIELNWLIADKNATKQNSQTVDEFVMRTIADAPYEGLTEDQVRQTIGRLIQRYPVGPRSYTP
jgi:hypothetical protein